MEIDDIIEILFDGEKEDIEKILKNEKVSYNFSDDLETYIVSKILSNGNIETVRGYKCTYRPNCIKYFGNIYEK